VSRPVDAAAPVDAATPIAVDVPADAAAIIPDAPAPSAITVVNDTWCDVTIDGVARGRLGRTAFAVAPGHHVVVCTQPNLNHTWTYALDVAPGETGVARGAMLPAFAVTVGVGHELSIDGKPYAASAVVQLRTGSHELEANGHKQFLDLHQACTLREHVADDGTTRIDCYP
jgi:hypothetical protein